MKNKRNKMGFTMVELLATIVILGILSTIAIVGVSGIINKSRNSQKESQEKTLEMAARNYLQTNTERLPKAIGETRKITAIDLKNANYLKKDLKNSSGEDCMDKSFVIVRKTSRTNYKYKASLYCGNDVVDDPDNDDGPEIEIHFKGTIEDGKIQDVSSAILSISIEGTKSGGKTIPIEGYSFSLSVRGDNEPSYREVYNSGTLNANNKKHVLIEKPISDYIDIATQTYIRAKVVARDTDGGYSEIENSSETEALALNDKTRPTCRNITGASKGSWVNATTNTLVKITAECKDGIGESGCVREKFSKTWPNEDQSDAEYTYIQVKDNAGNRSVDDSYINDPCSVTGDVKNDCRVLVNVDKTYPKIQLEAYKLDQNGNLDTSANVFKSNISTVIGNKKTKETGTIQYDSYNELTSGWMNQTKYPYGIGYRVKLLDSIHLASWKWETNAPNIDDRNSNSFQVYRTGNNSENASFTYPEVDMNQNNCGKRTDEITVFFKEDGMRRGRLTVTDKAGNSTIYYIEAYIDSTKPSCSVSVSGTKGSDGAYINKSVSVSLTKSDNGTSRMKQYGLSSSSTVNYNSKTTGSQGQTTGITWYGFVMDNAGNENVCNSGEFVVAPSIPTCSISIDGTVGSNGWYKGKDVTLTLNPGEGVVGYDLTTSKNETSVNYNKKTKTATQGNTSSSGVTWYGYVKDSAGNTGKCNSGTIKVDKTAPTISSISVVKSGTSTNVNDKWTNSNVQVKLSGADNSGNASGIDTWKYISTPQIQANVHVQSIGWLGYQGTTRAGTTGLGKNLEAFQLKVINSSTGGNIEYAINGGSFVTSGNTAGTTGVSNIIKTVAIRLTGDLANNYNVKYRAHRANVGWKDDEWVTNGTFTKNDGNNVQSIEILFEKKKNLWKSSGKNTTSYTHTFSTEQNTTNYFILCDLAGNCSSSKSAKVKIDKTKSILFITGDEFEGSTIIKDNCVNKFTPITGGTTSCDTRIDQWSRNFEYYDVCFDNYSGCNYAEAKYIHDGSGPKAWNWTAIGNITWRGKDGAVGTYRDIYLRNTDAAGNLSGTLKMHLHWP